MNWKGAKFKILSFAQPRYLHTLHVDFLLRLLLIRRIFMILKHMKGKPKSLICFNNYWMYRFSLSVGALHLKPSFQTGLKSWVVRRRNPISILRCLLIQARLNTLWLCKMNKSRLVTQHVKYVLVLPLMPVTQNVKPFLIHFLLSNRT